MKHSKNYILLGPPGSGKSTQAKRLQEAFGLIHIEMGAELRAAAQEDTPLGRKLYEVVNNRREFASDEIMAEVLGKALKRVPEDKGVLIDGSPRQVSQIEIVSRMLNDLGRPIEKVIFIDLSEEDAIKRISRRYLCLSCLHPYILGQDILSVAEKCGICGGQIGQRPDDTEEGARKRYRIFYEKTLPVLKYFEKENMLIRVEGGQSANEVFHDIVARL